jgi:hypothetical protein
VGLVFLAREGLSFASLRRMEEHEERVEDELVETSVEGELEPEPERRRARAGVPR